MSDLSRIDIISNETYADGYPHDGWTRLRREAPVYWYERPGVQPFWAITKHADLVAISKQPKLFENAPRLAVFPGLETEVAEPPPARHLLNMDPPDHGRFRRLVSSRFAPRALIPMTADVEPIAAEILDAFGNDGALSEADFVTGVSARLPLAVLADMLGVPRSDWQRLFQWTNETVGASDPEYQLEGESAPETADRARQELFQYFWSLVEERRRTPTEDIISVLANAELDGEPVPPFELVSYFYLLVVAGNETTRNATTGGLLALLQRPEEFDKLRRDPGLLDAAVEEIVRWTSPVIQFCRTPNQDVVLRGQRIRAGDSLTLFYP
ncbi:MAG: cytochrome P450, partial [Candidatus Binatia bacterium]